MSKSGDPRLGELLCRSCNDANVTAKVAILGYPCDIGVARNSGRVGAKHGPECVRKKLPKLGPLINPELNISLEKIHLEDRGDVKVGESLEENHAAMQQAVFEACQTGFIPVIVGGGNDQSFSNAKGLMQSLKSGNIGVVNIDAHFDVRPLLDGNLAHSGSPFRQLLEDSDYRKNGGQFVQFATQGNQCSMDHTRYIGEQGGKIMWLSQVQKIGVETAFQEVLRGFGEKPVFVSFDIDSIKGADCPGVSCPAVRGLNAQGAFDICFAAGKHPHTRALDLSEYNPLIEEDRTARLVVNMIYYFLLGVADRV